MAEFITKIIRIKMGSNSLISREISGNLKESEPSSLTEVVKVLQWILSSPQDIHHTFSHIET